MEKIKELIKEYEVRFNKTKNIKEGSGFIDKINEKFETITLNLVRTKEGIFYYNGIWAIADIKEIPERWVVELNSNYPKLEKLKNWLRENDYDYWHDLDFKSGYLGYNGIIFSFGEKLTDDCFIDYQYLTLEQWYNLIYLSTPKSKPTEPKIGDWGICYDNYELEKKQLKSVITINKLKEVCLLESYPYSILNTIRKYFFKIDLERPLQPQINEFLKLK